MSTQTRFSGKYTLLEKLGQDQLTEIWKAYDDQAQRYVVLKIFHAHLLNDPYFISRLEREAKEITAFHHPNLLRIYEMQLVYPPQVQNTTAYIVMDYVEGQTLADYIHHTSYQRTFPATSTIVSIFSAIGSAVDYAHQMGVSFCNARPTNILLSQSGTSQHSKREPVLINFEVPTLLGNSASVQMSDSAYLSPEQARGMPGNELSDIYLLGIALYEIFTGAFPFQDKDTKDGGRYSPRTIIAPEMRNPQISPVLSSVIMRCLLEDPTARFSQASTLAMALKDALNVSGVTLAGQASVPVSPLSLPTRRRRNPLLIALIVLLILLVLGSGLTALFLLNRPASSTASNHIVGHAYLASSGQVTDSSTDGLNDELQLVLANIPDPSPGKSYYLWLLSDVVTKPTSFIALGTVPISHGQVNRLYSTPQHTDLIATTSRILMTEEPTSPPPTTFSSDQRTWRYYAEIPQRTPSPGAPHLGAIRYLRFLIFESNKMIAQGIHGGSMTLILRNTQKVLEWAGSAHDDWALQHFDLINRHCIRILDYIDGSAFVSADLPPGTPLGVNPLLAQDGLITIVPGENPESFAPRAAFSILSFFQSVPNLSPQKRQLGLQIEQDVRVNIPYHLQLVRQYAKQLVMMSSAQLAQKSTLLILNAMLAEVRIAYSGEFDPTTGHFQGGILNNYNMIQLLASYDITPFSPQNV